jgi:hypothetical protein
MSIILEVGVGDLALEDVALEKKSVVAGSLDDKGV